MKKEKLITSLQNYKKELFLGPLFKVLEVIFELFMPFLMKYILDEGINKSIENNNYLPIIIPGLIILGLTLFGLFSTLICQYFASIASQGMGTDLRNRIFNKLNNLSLKEIDSFGREKILTILSNDTIRIQEGIAMVIRLVIRAPVLVIGSLIMSSFISIYAFYIFLVTTILLSLIIFIVFKISSKKVYKIQQTNDKLSVISNDFFQGVRVIKAFNKESDEIDKFKENTSLYYKETKINNFISSLVNPLTYLVINFAALLICYLVNYNSGLFGISSGSLAALITYLNQILTALVVISNLVLIFSRAFVAQKRISSFLNLNNSVENFSLYSNLKVNKGETLVSFNNVAFKYDVEHKNIVENLTFNILKGEKIGIIGGTGSGKTTIVNLIERFYDPSEGSIFYKGVPLKEYDLSTLRNEISFVNQKATVFKNSIKNNLLISNSNANEEEVFSALKDAEAFDFVSKYSDFYEHFLVEEGKNLSGGQRQRISIARGLIKKSEILILDDSTSALDFLTEKKVNKNIEKNKDLTLIKISQRISSLKNLDKIIVLDHGKIDGIGTHEELMNSSKVYKEIYESQIGI